VAAGCGDALFSGNVSNAPRTAPNASTAPIDPSAQVSAPAPIDPDQLDPSTFKPLLDDPRLAGVKALAADPPKAAQALAALLASSQPSPEDRAAWSYQLGRLRVAAGDSAGAARAFQDAGAVSWTLAPWAHVEAAQALNLAGQYDASLAEIAKI